MANGTDNGKPESNQRVIQIVVLALAFLAMIGMGSLGYCMVSGTKPDATLLTAFVGLTASLVGYLGGILSRTTPTSSTQDVKVTNEKKDPVPTEPAQQTAFQ